MKFRVEREELNEVLGDVSRIATSRTSAMPALAGVEMVVSGDTLTLSTTDREISMQSTLSVGGQRDGVAVPNARVLTDLVRGLPDGKLQISAEGESLVVEAARNRSSVLCYATNDFPKILLASAPEGTVPAGLFGEALRQVVRAASADLTRLALTGVLLSNQSNGLTMVATDSYRLAVRQVAGTSLAGESTVIVPARALGELLRLIKDHETITYRLAADRATFTVGGTTISTSLLNVQFPNYNGLVQPSYPNTLSTNRETLLDAVRRSKVYARDTIPVRLTQAPGSLKLSVHTNDTGETIEELDADYKGPEMTIGFNPDYLLQGIEACNGETISIESSDPIKPAVLRGSTNDGYLYLLMPQRLTS